MNVQNTVTGILQDQSVNLVIGYGEGSYGKIRPLFVKGEADVPNLVYDDRCTRNLAGYLVKKEIKQFGKLAVIANNSTLRSIIRLAGEHQLKEENILTIGVDKNGETTVLPSFAEIETYIANLPPAR
jgi:hypothetical protein